MIHLVVRKCGLATVPREFTPHKREMMDAVRATARMAMGAPNADLLVV